MNLPLNLDAQKSNENSILGGFLKQNCQMRSSVPLGPFTGYASVLKSSRFLTPAQQILDDFCGVDYRVLDFPLESLGDGDVGKDPITCSDKIQHRWKNSRLVLMLDEVCMFLPISVNTIQIFNLIKLIFSQVNAKTVAVYISLPCKR